MITTFVTVLAVSLALTAVLSGKVEIDRGEDGCTITYTPHWLSWCKEMGGKLKTLRSSPGRELPLSPGPNGNGCRPMPTQSNNAPYEG